jgi:hypothetical protein
LGQAVKKPRGEDEASGDAPKKTLLSEERPTIVRTQSAAEDKRSIEQRILGTHPPQRRGRPLDSENSGQSQDLPAKRPAGTPMSRRMMQISEVTSLAVRLNASWMKRRPVRAERCQ